MTPDYKIEAGETVITIAVPAHYVGPEEGRLMFPNAVELVAMVQDQLARVAVHGFDITKAQIHFIPFTDDGLVKFGVTRWFEVAT